MISLGELVETAKQGYRAAQADVPPMRCPYGPAWPGGETPIGMYPDGGPLAHAWYKGYWFWHHIMKRWSQI